MFGFEMVSLGDKVKVKVYGKHLAAVNEVKSKPVFNYLNLAFVCIKIALNSHSLIKNILWNIACLAFLLPCSVRK